MSGRRENSREKEGGGALAEHCPTTVGIQIIAATGMWSIKSAAPSRRSVSTLGETTFMPSHPASDSLASK
eukprot:10060404-Heterocapsa_arctica.AAC.1